MRAWRIIEEAFPRCRQYISLIKERGTTLICGVISRDLVGYHGWVKLCRITIDCCNSAASEWGFGGELTLPGCVCESRLMKWFVTSLMTKGTLFHRHGITDVKTNLAPLKGF